MLFVLFFSFQEHCNSNKLQSTQISEGSQGKESSEKDWQVLSDTLIRKILNHAEVLFCLKYVLVSYALLVFI